MFTADDTQCLQCPRGSAGGENRPPYHDLVARRLQCEAISRLLMTTDDMPAYRFKYRETVTARRNGHL
jgi:hypothetical protein